MSMPVKNIMFSQLKENTDVTFEATKNGKNGYWVAVIDGECGVVIMDGQHQEKQEKRLEELVRHTKMRAKGYTIMLTPKSLRFEPLYVKRVEDVGGVMREYPAENFFHKTIT